MTKTDPTKDPAGGTAAKGSRGTIDIRDDYAEEYGFHDPETYFHKGRKGIDHEVVEMISQMKKEPDWMRLLRHEALDIFFAKPMPNWGDTELLNSIDFDNIFYYIKPMGSRDAPGRRCPRGSARPSTGSGSPKRNARSSPASRRSTSRRSCTTPFRRA